MLEDWYRVEQVIEAWAALAGDSSPTERRRYEVGLALLRIMRELPSFQALEPFLSHNGLCLAYPLQPRTVVVRPADSDVFRVSLYDSRNLQRPAVSSVYVPPGDVIPTVLHLLRPTSVGPER
ncbi:MAG: hypothetical protein OHK0023_00430 [Anaerolineae bacterium]